MHQDLAKALFGRAKCSSPCRFQQEKSPLLCSLLVAEAALPGPSKQMSIPISPSNDYSFQFSSFVTVAFPEEPPGTAGHSCALVQGLGAETGVWRGFTADPAWPQSSWKSPPCSWQRISTGTQGWSHSPCPASPDLTANVQEKDFLLSSGEKSNLQEF